MKRKRIPRWPPLPPRGLRPKLTKDQVRDLGLVHISNLDKIVRGEGDEAVLWHWVEAALTWSYVAGVLQRRSFETYREAADSMRLQFSIAESVIERYGRTGRVGFSGPEYQQARDACEWMDALAEVVDRPTAIAAADWSELCVNKWAQQCAEHERKAA